MRDAGSAELVMGSVQLGLAYGAANRTGKPAHDAALRLARHALAAGISTFDTAHAYGDSEDRLGEALGDVPIVQTVTKLSPLSELDDNAPRGAVRRAVDHSVMDSLTRLRRETLGTLLLHRAAHLTAFDGAVWERLLELRALGIIARLGVSVQSPEEAGRALSCTDVAHIQLPFNLLDWRWAESGVIEKLSARSDLTVHVRSIFLQGLLVCGDPHLWPRIDGTDAAMLIADLDEFVSEYGRESAADLCLAYARGQNWIDGVVVGMETEEQLDTNLRLSRKPALAQTHCMEIAARIPRVPAPLLDPSQWPARAQ